MNFGLVLVLLSLWAPPLAAQVAPYCLPRRELRLAGLSIGDSPMAVRRRLGAPQSIDSSWVREDTGGHREYSYGYHGLEVVTGPHGVESVYAHDSTSATPAGIRVGQTLLEVARRLRASPELIGRNRPTWTPAICGKRSDQPTLSFSFTPGAPQAQPVMRLVRIDLEKHIEP